MGAVELNVLSLMKDKGIDPSVLADLPGIGEEGAEKILKGNVSAIRLSSLAAICDALECEPGDVLRYIA